MPRSGGTYTLPESAFVSDTVISSTAVNSNFSDIASEITASIAKDGQTTTTAAIPFAAGVQTDTVAEKTTGAGVTVDGVLLKDGDVTVSTSVVFEGTTADAFETTITVTDPTADRTITLPDATGTVAIAGDFVFATQGEAEAGSNTTAYMNPLRTAQAVIAYPGALTREVRNAALAASVGSNALTVALKGWDGNDPSANNPVIVPFRSATAATGTLAALSVTSALSLTISSGSTMGASSGVPFRIWVGIFNDGGTARLGAILCTTSGGIYRLADDVLASATAEGGAGGADTAQTIYAGSAVTSKAFRVLGYLDWSSGLSTAGTWDAGPDVVQMYHPGVPLPGEAVNTEYLVSTTAFSTSNTTYTDVTGLTNSIVPRSACNPVEATLNASLASTSGGGMVQLVRGSTAIHVGTAASNRPGASGSVVSTENMVTVTVLDFPSSTSSTTYKAQARAGSSGTTGINRTGADSDNADNPRTASSIVLKELQA